MKNKKSHLFRRIRLFSSSIIVGGLVSYMIFNVMRNNGFVINVENMIDVSKVMIGVWGTLLGFIITAESILVAFSNGTITSEFKKTGHYMTVIFQYTQTSIKLLFYIFIFIAVIVMNVFNMKIMFLFIFFSLMTFIDVLISFVILIIMLKMANK